MNLFDKKKIGLFLIFFILFNVYTGFAQTEVPTHPTAPQLLISPIPAYFGRIPVVSSALRDVLIFNIGTSVANISSIDIQGTDHSDFTIVKQEGSTNLNPLDVLKVTIEFKPVSEGNKLASLVINSNAGTNSDSLTGAGTRVRGNRTSWERIFGGTESDNGNSLQITSDGGFVIAGSTLASPDEDYPDMYIVKTDGFGKVLWSKNYGGKFSEGATDIKQTGDGGYVVAGYTDSEGAGGTDATLTKLDANGNLTWSQNYGGNQNDHFYSVLPTPDGGYIAVGSFISESGQNRDAYLVKVNGTGQETWSHTFGGSNGGETGYSVLLTSDGGYIFAGETTSFGAGGFDAYLVKTNSSGIEVWSKTYGGTEDDKVSYLQPTADGGYVMTGSTVSSGAGAKDVYLLKTDGSGNLQWSQAYGDVHNDGGSSVKQTADGGYVIVGSTVNRIAGNPQKQYSDVYLVKTTSDGVLQWTKIFGSLKSESGSEIQITADGGYAFIGSAGSFSKENDIYFLKSNEQGMITSLNISSLEVPESFSLFQNYPNPFNSQTTIRYQLPGEYAVTLNLFDISGRKIKTLVNQNQNAGVHTLLFDGDGIASGVYFYQLKAGSHVRVRKMIILE